MTNASNTQSNLPKNQRGWLGLCLCVIIVSIVWLALLPALSQIPSLQSEIEHQKKLGIDASAMFYTELDAMDNVLERLDNFHRKHPTALWLPRNRAKTD